MTEEGITLPPLGHLIRSYRELTTQQFPAVQSLWAELDKAFDEVMKTTDTLTKMAGDDSLFDATQPNLTAHLIQLQNTFKAIANKQHELGKRYKEVAKRPTEANQHLVNNMQHWILSASHNYEAWAPMPVETLAPGENASIDIGYNPAVDGPEPPPRGENPDPRTRIPLNTL